MAEEDRLVRSKAPLKKVGRDLMGGGTPGEWAAGAAIEDVLVMG